MQLRFKYKVRPGNLWVLTMINMYRSMIGVVNVVFTLSIVLLAVRFWPEASLFVRLLITAGILLFPVFQPLIIYLRSKKIVAEMPDNLEMIISDKGIEVQSGNKHSHMKFEELKSILMIRGILVLYTQSKQSFILNKQVLDGKGQDLYDFLSKNRGNQK